MSLAAFGVRKPVPVNLLMAGLIIAGIFSATTLRKEFFPQVDAEAAIVTLVYPGASPEEVEETLAIKVEDAVIDLDEVDEVRSTVSEGGGGVTIEFVEGQDPDEALREIERKIDALRDLPAESEEITASLLEPTLPVIMVAISGDLDERVLKSAVRGVRDDLRTLPGMGTVRISGVRGDELRIDVRQSALLEQGISLTQVSDAVRGWMREVPGGTVKSAAGNTAVRTMGVEERAAAIEQIVLKATPDGRVVTLGDVANVTDGFIDDGIINRFNEQPAAILTVFSVGEQDIVKIAQMVRAYVAARAGQPFPGSWLDHKLQRGNWRAYELGRNSPHALPVNATVTTLTDLARFVEGRLDLLTRNAFNGAILVFATLLLFLNWRVALWVGVGLVTALGGTLILMSAAGVTLNLLTMFGLIVVLGLLVDDAIVVSENIVSMHEKGVPALEAAIKGTADVLWPVVATVTTTVVAFIPLTFIKGSIGDLLGALPWVVACALLMSLVEAVFILPSHMGHSLKKRDGHTHISKATNWLHRFERWRDRMIHERLVPWYGQYIRWALRYRYISSAIVLAVFIASVGLVTGNHVPFTFLPDNDAETVQVNVRMPIGSPLEHTFEAVRQIEHAAGAIPEVAAISSIVGQQGNLDTGQDSGFSSHIAQLFIELVKVEERDKPSPVIIAEIRAALAGKLDEADRVQFEAISGGPGGADISLRLSGPDTQRLEAAAQDLKQMLAKFEGVVDIADDNDLGQQEQRIVPRPAALASVGLTPADLATQVRGFLFGLDAHVFAANEEDIDVRLRVDEATRRSLGAIENAWVVTPAGQRVPITEVADIVPATTYASIKRVDRQRSITVTADTNPGISPEAVMTELNKAPTKPVGWAEWFPARIQKYLPTVEVDIAPLQKLKREYPSVTFSSAGRQEQVADAFSTLPIGAGAAALMIYIILAWLFSSYWQPLVVMMIIPFSLIGAVWGHLLLGFEMTFLSLIGLIALAGIVVNDSLILVEFFNMKRAEGLSVFESLVSAGMARLRAILLTTITTVLGLTPLILEQSFQARFLIPMAISIAAGLIVATVLILGLLPCFMLILHDIGNAAYYLWHGRPRPRTTPKPITHGHTAHP